MAQKVVYLSYSDVPKRVIKGQIFPVTIKSLSTIEFAEDIEYTFAPKSGVEILNDIPQRERKGKYFYDTFFLIATTNNAKIPDVQATLISDTEYESSFLSGVALEVVSLNPTKEYANIIANSLELLEYKTTSYDHEHNIIVFVAQADNSAIEKFHFNNVFKQGIESVRKSYALSKITYYIIVDKKIENFSFSYFNLKKNKFITLSIPIIVDEDRVTTQTDLKPQDQSHDTIKLIFAATMSGVIIIFVFWRKKFIYLILLLLPVGYLIYSNKPTEKLCVKAGAKIYLLPVYNGTIFETTTKENHWTQSGNVGNFIKVELPSEQIGWVKNEDTCSY